MNRIDDPDFEYADTQALDPDSWEAFDDDDGDATEVLSEKYRRIDEDDF